MVASFTLLFSYRPLSSRLSSFLALNKKNVQQKPCAQFKKLQLYTKGWKPSKSIFCILDAAKQNNACKKCMKKLHFFLFRPITALYTKNCPQNCLKKVSFSKLPQITFFAPETTKMKLLGHFQTLWTLLQSHEAMNLTLVQFFGKRVRILWPLKKTLFSDFRLCWWSNNKKKSLKKLKTLRN